MRILSFSAIFTRHVRKNTIGITSKDLQACIQDLGTECLYFSTFDAIENFYWKIVHTAIC